MKDLKKVKAVDGTIRALILEDADGEVSYIKDVAEHGCVGGSCSGLIYYKDTHAFYNEYADEIDEILARIADEMGESYDIQANMKRLGQSDMRNFLAWFAYEVEAQEIMRELDPKNY